ncbi:MAG: 3-deoxy-manno-octulosonate cytidylyltransferase [Rhodospirillales bacterium]|nr:3-deoxy-manno-octulosonate cytidylyltransferase [Rhodospirillales bacterium]
MAAIVLIPARLASTRLPGKPLAEIAGAPMIVQVWRRAMEADCGRVAVAAAEPEIADAVAAAGGEAVLTDPDLPSGSDRIFQALQRLDPDGEADTVINVQGDLPTLDPQAIRSAVDALAAGNADLATLVAEIDDAAERTDPSVVKAVVSWQDSGYGRALYFTRATAPTGEGPLWHHVGLYVYRRAALEEFVGLPVSDLERRERLEQLRALEAGMTIAVARVDSIPPGVDTPADLERARAILAPVA